MIRSPVTILDCGHGNLASVANAVSALGREPLISSEPKAIASAQVLIFPGQGAAPPAMKALSETGLGASLLDVVKSGIPVLGICLGMQLALDRSLEGPVDCLSLIPGDCEPFRPDADHKVPQIGWNTVHHSGDPLFQDIPDGSHFYFVHSYFCAPAPQFGIGWTEYGRQYVSALQRDRFWATQFHPEKSGAVGLRLLANFLDLAGC